MNRPVEPPLHEPLRAPDDPLVHEPLLVADDEVPFLEVPPLDPPPPLDDESVSFLSEGDTQTS
jgi:hypothetical protein